MICVQEKIMKKSNSDWNSFVCTRKHDNLAVKCMTFSVPVKFIHSYTAITNLQNYRWTSLGTSLTRSDDSIVARSNIEQRFNTVPSTRATAHRRRTTVFDSERAVGSTTMGAFKFFFFFVLSRCIHDVKCPPILTNSKRFR